MQAVLNRPDRWGAAANIALPLGLVVIANVLIFSLGLGLTEPAYLSLPLAPPGWLVALVWYTIFVLWGYARWLVVTRDPALGNEVGWWLVVLMVMGLLFPISSRNFDPTGAVIDSAMTLGLYVFVAWRLSTVSRPAAALMLPAIAWVSFVTYLSLSIDPNWPRAAVGA